MREKFPGLFEPSEAFLARFIPRSIRDQLRDQFARLEQGSMTVSEYEAQFHELSRHAAMILPTEEERVRCFVRGLRLQLRIETQSLVSAGRSFLDVVDHARTIEQLRREAQGGSGKRARQEDSYDRRRFRPRESYDRSQQRFQSGQSSSPFQAALQASEGDQHRHIGCSAGPSRGRDSSQMGSSGRGSRHAPAPPARGRGQGQDRRGGHQGIRGGPRGGRLGGRADAQGRGVQAHFYAPPGREDAETSDDVITGTVLLCQQPALALFDPGSTFSYVSVYYASRLSLMSEPLVAPLRVSTPVGEFLVVDQGSLGSTPVGVISFIRGRRLVASGCLSYLAYVRDVSREVPPVESVPVIRDFLYVFPTDLPHLPSERDTDFPIELELGTHPISNPPYRMSPAELKELSVQLQDLLGK
ncbi:uncharacterized protein [Solanum tuberosum]|uniref:uncharacterized protein n=1 Tax=Solanum tuberosum TaxID=4113 RepID=UPI00073A20C6|nr:PREDICTED: uncharacterized protein LOC107058212 [Solanum tuberosum]